jgi:RNA polymerase sigma factor (sigma-70 family)
MSDEFLTRNTLLQRAQNPKDEQAWAEFVSYYETLIFILLRQMNIPYQDCDDLTQAVLIKVWKKLATFNPERAKFRTWLSTLIRNTVINHWDSLSRRNRRVEKYGENVVEPPSGLPSTPEFDVMFQREWEAYITNLAMENIRSDCSANAMRVFELVMKEVPSSEIAKRLGLNISSVSTMKGRVLERLVREVRRLRHELEL